MCKNRPYFLVHITLEKLLQKIKNTNGFKKSIHDISQLKNQWLGDGVYFWDSNDEKAIEIGKKLVLNKSRNRFKKQSCVGIYVQVEINLDKYINLEEHKNREIFYKFIKSADPKDGNQIVDTFEMLRNKKVKHKEDMELFGKYLGKYINLYVEYLKEQKNKEIDMVSCYFIHKNNKTLPFARGELAIKQFCIKNLELVNNNIDNWEIVNNI